MKVGLNKNSQIKILLIKKNSIEKWKSAQTSALKFPHFSIEYNNNNLIIKS